MSQTLRVLTLNMHKGYLFRARNSKVALLKSCLIEEQIDLVCLQEVRGFHEIYAPVPQFEELADQVWKHHAYGQNAVYSAGHHGNAILSHFPFTSQRNIDISNHKLERRGFLHGLIGAPEWGDQCLHVVTLHLDLTAWGRRRQLRQLHDWLKTNLEPDAPLILTGDFNDWTGEAHRMLFEDVGLHEANMLLTGKLARSFPSWFPMLRLDRIYSRGIVATKVEAKTNGVWRKLSDHLPLIAEFTWPPAAR